MKLTVLGGCGAWPAFGQACSGYVVEDEGFRVLIDPGYAIVPRLTGALAPERIDAVLVSHKHPDHCADLNPLLRARALRDDPAPPLPVVALPGALDAVLALDRPGMLDAAIELRTVAAGDRFTIGPFTVETRSLPHFVPNIGFRIAAGGSIVAYTGDCGPDDGVVELARDVDLLLAEATFARDVPSDSNGLLSSARDAATEAARAGVGRLVLTHLSPGEDPAVALERASIEFGGTIDVAGPGLEIDLTGGRGTY